MSLDLPKTYDAKAHEADVYRRWESAGCFKAGAGKQAGKPAYSIAIPPPNVTGVLHMGHALNNTLQDTLIRWKRMQGCDVLWQPGTDHAGIATEAVVAKQLASGALKTEGAARVTREELGRDEFIKMVWTWKERSGGQIVSQLRKLGSSCDWSRERFTMDAGLSRAVRENFVRLYRDGLIYRGTRMVNWSPVLKTALSDDEVVFEEKNGWMWKLRYDLSDGSGHIAVETTRPETFFGDTAVAVNPNDPRYRAMIGRKVRLPIVGREIPIIADAYADPEKGTGAVKITPAHDPNDYEVGQRHHLPLLRVIEFDGTMNAHAKGFSGLDRFECRKRLLHELELSGHLLGKTEIRHSVGHSERSGEPIEPMVTEQWFVRMRPLAERALKETNEGRVAFHPAQWTKVYCHWLENVRDWCISRQIWWGHRIPAWHDQDSKEIVVALDDPTKDPKYAGRKLVQDPDVLDTWFSSALWPFSTLGWPDQTPELTRYYPTSTLVTDRGIIYFWVARMVMMGMYDLGSRPFNDVYIHGTVNDERGVKMSKSLGNGIDPIVMIEGGTQSYLGKDYDCPGYGADAVRFTLLEMTTEGQDLKLNPGKFESGRHFANKVWNAGRFLLMNLAERPLAKPATAEDVLACRLGFVDRWLLDRLQRAVDECHDALTRFRFSEYVTAAYRFFHDDLCDWYVEWAKRQFKAGGDDARAAATVLWYAFDRVLRLLHPGMPFLSELLWQQLQTTAGGQAWATDEAAARFQEQQGTPRVPEHTAKNRFLMLTSWPEPDARLRDDGAQPRMAELQAIVTAVRNVRNQQQLADGVHLTVSIQPKTAARGNELKPHVPFLDDRGNCTCTVVPPEFTKQKATVTTVVGDLKVHVWLQGAIDLEAFKAGILKRLATLEKSVAGKQSRLGNADYVARAPAQQVQETRDLLAKEQLEIANLKETLAGL